MGYQLKMFNSNKLECLDNNNNKLLAAVYGTSLPPKLTLRSDNLVLKQIPALCSVLLKPLELQLQCSDKSQLDRLCSVLHKRSKHKDRHSLEVNPLKEDHFSEVNNPSNKHHHFLEDKQQLQDSASNSKVGHYSVANPNSKQVDSLELNNLSKPNKLHYLEPLNQLNNKACYSVNLLKLDPFSEGNLPKPQALYLERLSLNNNKAHCLVDLNLNKAVYLEGQLSKPHAVYLVPNQLSQRQDHCSVSNHKADHYLELHLNLKSAECLEQPIPNK